MVERAISVVVVNYNGRAYIADCLSALSAQTFRDFEVIVVDNGSTDGSLALIKRDFSWVTCIPLGTNTGFAAGNNYGIKASSSAYVATLNNDAIPEAAWLEQLHAVAESDTRIGMVASRVLLGKEGNVLDSAGMLLYSDGMTRQRGRGEPASGRFETIEEVLFPSACAALYRRAMLDTIGLFDEAFFCYCEDSDLGLRARLAGWKAVYTPAAVVRHLYSMTGGKYSELKAYYIERNRVWVLLKNFPLSFIALFPLYTVWRYGIQLFGLVTGRGSVARLAENSGKNKLATIALRALGGALGGVPGILKKRRAVWSARRISDNEYKKLLKKHAISAAELMLRE